jgi:hypothetical protein
MPGSPANITYLTSTSGSPPENTSTMTKDEALSASFLTMMEGHRALLYQIIRTYCPDAARRAGLANFIALTPLGGYPGTDDEGRTIRRHGTTKQQPRWPGSGRLLFLTNICGKGATVSIKAFLCTRAIARAVKTERYLKKRTSFSTFLPHEKAVRASFALALFFTTKRCLLGCLDMCLNCFSKPTDKLLRMTFRHFPTIVLLAILAFSCDGDKVEMIAAFDEVEALAQSDEKEKLYDYLDQESIALVDIFTDTSYMKSELFLNYGAMKGLEITASVYQYEVGDLLDLVAKDKSFFFFYQALSGVPLFNIFGETKVLKDQSESGPKGYVTVATRVNETAWLTSKVMMTKEGEEYKLNLISLMKSREKIYGQEYRAFRNSFSNLDGRTMMQAFIEERTKEEHQLKELTYRRQ